MEELISVTGHRLHTARWSPQGEPKAVVFISHGVSEHSGRYESIAKHLNESGYLVAAHDHVGHGQSEGDRIHIDSIELYARDVIQHVERLKEEHPNLPIFLFGHSMGGTVAAYTTILRQDLFKGLILSAAALVADPETAGFFLRLGARVMSVFFPQAGVKAVPIDVLSRIPEEVEKYRNDPLVYHGKLKAKWAVAMLNAVDFFGQHFSEITIPLLLVHGDADQLVNIASSQFGYDTASSTDKTLEVFKGGFHELFNDLERDRFLVLLVEWLNQRFDKEDTRAAGEGTAAEEGETPKDAPGGEPPKEVPSAEEPPKDVPPADEPSEEVPPADEPSEEVPPADEPSEEVPQAEEPPKDVPPADEPSEEVPPADEPSKGEQLPESEGDTPGEDTGEQDSQ